MSAVTSENGNTSQREAAPNYGYERVRVLWVRSVVLGCALYTLFAVHALAELYGSLPYSLLSNALLLSFQGFYGAFALLFVHASPKASALAAVGALSVVLVL